MQNNLLFRNNDLKLHKKAYHLNVMPIFDAKHVNINFTRDEHNLQ